MANSPEEYEHALNLYALTCADQELGYGVTTPLKNHKAIGFPINFSPDTLKITKLPGQHSMLGHHRPASEAPFQWHFAGGQMIAHFK